MNRGICLLACASLIVSPVATLAQQAPGDLSDLVGARGSSFDGEMERRGYEFVKNVGVAGFWWNGNRRTCVAAAIDNGRISSIQSTAAGDCGRAGGSGNAGSGNSDAAAAIAVGALAVGLAAALSQHHKNDARHNNPGHNNEYERGYNDAMYGSNYSEDDSEGYHSGYMAGESERNNRRYANSSHVRSAPGAAQSACARRGDHHWDLPAGSTVPVNVYDYGQGNYEVTVASGHRRASCSVNSNGNVTEFEPL